ncbi:MAG: insulinase family protein [Abitibacteriaceae bacterium]|nr:insulinase family protein [Abditibacteriaceae bacterium]
MTLLFIAALPPILPLRADTSAPAASAPATGRKTLASPNPINAKSATATGGRANLFNPALLSERTLPNGVRGVVRETRGTGLVSVQIWVRAGSRYETAANNGVSHMIENLAMHASKNYPRSPSGGIGGGASDAINALGGVAGSLTSRDSTFYSATVASIFLSAAVRALSDATLHPNLTDGDVESAKAEVEDDVLRRGQDPLGTASDLAYRTAFAKHPYNKPAAGTEASLEALNGAKVRSYYNARYVGSNISVVVVGDVKREAAYRLIERYFGEAAAAKPPQDTIPAEQAPKTFKSISRRLTDPGTTLALAFRSPGISTPQDVVAMDVLLSYWKEGRDATLRQVLLGGADTGNDDTGDSGDNAANGNDQTDSSTTDTSGKEPLALAFDVDFLTQRDPGLFLVTLRVDPQNQESAVTATLNEFGRVRSQGIDVAGLKRAKRQLTTQYIQQSETVSGQAGALGFYEMIDTYDFAATYLDRIQHVTLADIKRVANRYLSKTAYVQVILQPTPRPTIPNPRNNDGGTFTARADSPEILRHNVTS